MVMIVMTASAAVTAISATPRCVMFRRTRGRRPLVRSVRKELERLSNLHLCLRRQGDLLAVLVAKRQLDSHAVGRVGAGVGVRPLRAPALLPFARAKVPVGQLELGDVREN